MQRQDLEIIGEVWLHWNCEEIVAVSKYIKSWMVHCSKMSIEKKQFKEALIVVGSMQRTLGMKQMEYQEDEIDPPVARIELEKHRVKIEIGAINILMEVHIRT
jgi:uracil phosphoribosyltransferase